MAANVELGQNTKFRRHSRWRQPNTTSFDAQGEKLSMRQKHCYGVGHIQNDLIAYAGFSYLLVFFTKVVGISSGNTGIIFLTGQVANSVLSPAVGYACDRFRVPFLGRVGHRKAWHLIGVLIMAGSLPFLFSPCLPCSETSSEWVALIYYTVVLVATNFGFTAIEISHLSLLPKIAVRSTDFVKLNSLRTAWMFLSGIFVYGLMWILLGESSGENLSHDQWREFMSLGLIISGLGIFFAGMFHIGTKEPKKDHGVPSHEINNPCFENDDDNVPSAMATSPVELRIENLLQKVESDSNHNIHMNDSKLANQSIANGIPVNHSVANGIPANHSVANGIPANHSVANGIPANHSVANGIPANHSVANRILAKHIIANRGIDNMSFDSEVVTSYGLTPCHDTPRVTTGHITEKTSACNHRDPERRGQQEKISKAYHWFKRQEFYTLCLVFMCTKVVINMSNSYFPLYLVDALHFEKEAIAYFPLIVLVSSSLFSYLSKKITRYIGNKMSFCAGAVGVIGAYTWFYIQPISSKQAVYGASVLMGGGYSLMLVTMLTMLAEMINHIDKESGAFVYGTASLVDKLANGIIIAVIQEFYPKADSDGRCLACDGYIRLVFSMATGSAAALSLIVVLAFYRNRTLPTSSLGEIKAEEVCTSGDVTPSSVDIIDGNPGHVMSTIATDDVTSNTDDIMIEDNPDNMTSNISTDDVTSNDDIMIEDNPDNMTSNIATDDVTSKTGCNDITPERDGEHVTVMMNTRL
ncbi:major facilitator superfamily domain-containing protein 12 [Nematostella vectensis]|uniref:major facilitator superfamily domain-containing protein 12 n=1 Tax=Nematostella vectensis TaxID=45351 RepID=UPI0013904571|nr:major facilitator superfamily domain-containing protein 12 [Nematostella vectensis]